HDDRIDLVPDERAQDLRGRHRRAMADEIAALGQREPARHRRLSGLVGAAPATPQRVLLLEPVDCDAERALQALARSILGLEPADALVRRDEPVAQGTRIVA